MMEHQLEEEVGQGGRGRRRCCSQPLDRSKVRILLCDKDAKSSQEVLQLLYKCSYQVTPVRTARQVIEVLNAQGPDIDIILAEVDLPIAKGLKMLKYIMSDKELRRIPIIMMSAQDEASVVVKCLRLGAVDYLVKPLRTNELLNLWIHMWRRRRMLGLAEKDVLGHEFELSLSDPSDGNTNSTNMISDDTEDKQCKATHPEIHLSNLQEYESNASAVDSTHNKLLENEPNVEKDVDHAGIFLSSGRSLSCPKKTGLKFGECSAFLTYIKTAPASNTTPSSHVDGKASQPEPPLNGEPMPLVGGDIESFDSRGVHESYPCGNGLVTTEDSRDMNTFPMPMEFPLLCLSSSNSQPQSRNEARIDVSGGPSIFPFPIYVPGMIEQNMMLPSMPMFHGGSADPQYNLLPQCQRVPTIPLFSYHPLGIHLQSGQIPAPLLWSSMTSSSTPSEVKSGPTDRRAVALIKFRQKRKDRCFDKIRYVNRNRLAEKRPRVRGQFVRQVDGVDVHLNGLPAVCGGDSDRDEDDKPTSRELEFGSSPEHASEC